MAQQRRRTQHTVLCMHWICRSPAAQAILGNTRYPYAYFNAEFPELFSKLYLLIKDTAGSGDDWTKREMLEMYFPS